MNQQLFNPNGPETLFMQADKLIQLGDTAEAAGLLSNLIAEFPDFGRAYNHLGYLWETESSEVRDARSRREQTKFRDFAQAEKYYKTCLKLCPQYPAIYYNYAVLLSTQNRLAELEPLLKTAIQVPGVNRSKIHNEFGILQEKQGKHTAAIESYQKAIQYSFSTKDIAVYRASIQRAREKKMFFSQLSQFPPSSN